MTTVSFQAYGTMDLSHSDDEMQTHADMIVPEDLELDDADVMRDASIEPDQDLMNQDLVDMTQAGDDDMFDEETIDEGSMTMADDVDIDVGQNIDSYEDEDIIYEDDDEVVNADDHDPSAEQGLEITQSTKGQSLSDKPLDDYVSIEDRMPKDFQGQHHTVENEPTNQEDHHELESATNEAILSPSRTLSEDDTNTTARKPSGSITYAGSTSNLEQHVPFGALAGNDDLGSPSSETSNVDEPPGLQISEFNQTASGDSTIDAADANEDLFNAEEKTQHDDLVESEVSKTLTALDPDSANAVTGKDLHENAEEAGSTFNDSNAFQHGLHPVTIHYAQAEFSLFPPHDENDESDFFVEDESLALQGLDKLLCACREVLAGSIGDHDEVTLDIPSLGLHISEGSLLANQISLSQILDVYLSLHRNDGKISVNPLTCELQTRLCLTSQYNSLQKAAQGGKGMSDIPNPFLTQHPQPGNIEEASQVLPSTKDERHENVETSSAPLQTTDSGGKDAEPNKLSANNETEGVQRDNAEHSLEDVSKLIQATISQPTNGSTYEEGEPDQNFGGNHAVESVKVSGDEQGNSTTEGRSRPIQDQESHPLDSEEDQIFLEIGADFNESSGASATNITTQTPVPKEPYDDEHHALGNDLLDFDTSNQHQHNESIDVTGDDEKLRILEPESVDFPVSEGEQISTNAEGLVDGSDANISGESTRTQSIGHAKQEHNNVPYGMESSTTLSSNLPSDHQLSKSRQTSSDIDQLDHNNTSAVEEDQIDPDNDGFDLVDVHDGDATHDFNEGPDVQENSVHSNSAPNNGTDGIKEDTELEIEESTNVGTHVTNESDSEKTELDTIDFDFVEAEENAFVEEPSMQRQAAQPADQASTPVQNNSALNTSPRSSKRKAQDPIDDYEAIEIAPSDTKRRRNS